MRWWPLFVAIYFGIVAYFPPATFVNNVSINLFSWLAWAVFGSSLLAVIFPRMLVFRAAMATFAVSRSIAAITTTVYEHDLLEHHGFFWTKFFLLHGTLMLNLTWVTMYAATLPYMKAINDERRD